MPIVQCKIGKTTKIWHEDLVNLYGCRIGENCKIGAFVEIGADVDIGNRVVIGAHSFIPGGVGIYDDVWIGPGVVFTNDKYPPSGGKENWKQIFVHEEVVIGARALILPGVTLGSRCFIGAGAVVTRDVKRDQRVIGVPARCMTTSSSHQPLTGRNFFKEVWSRYVVK